MNSKTPDTPHWDLGRIVTELRQTRERWRAGRSRDFNSREFPSRDKIDQVCLLLRSALFPLRLGPADLRREGEDFFVGHALDSALTTLRCEVQLEISHLERSGDTPISDAQARQRAAEIVTAFANALPRLRQLLDTDVEAAFRGDPAARSVDEVLLCYPGVLALVHHRIAHELYALGAPLIARIVAELAHSETGIDIHPGATIGPHFFIDHGTGVVIGETAVIGQNVRLYQHVTLGAKRFETAEDGSLEKGQPRHPIVEDDVVIYAGATILGRVTIGHGSTIGGNVWLTRSLPAGSSITQASSQSRDPHENGSA
ncbi:serine O-acetyltransferase EpsC [Solimonas marina]|uniref:serine O-acetyltransferase n=1 Tax=Solimonas marina TaxID=2714601 RepID=A0A969W9P0_9GAMM|nr:serine O-acetyltransferase EpsC [Solimonas marina]NKF22038.1 serine acetyltransferase [Solimonas marina]